MAVFASCQIKPVALSLVAVLFGLFLHKRFCPRPVECFLPICPRRVACSRCAFRYVAEQGGAWRRAAASRHLGDLIIQKPPDKGSFEPLPAVFAL